MELKPGRPAAPRLASMSMAGLLYLGMCAGLNAATPQVDTLKGNVGEIEIIPIQHATFALKWSGKTILVDPVGGAAPFAALGKPALILITDIHGDHFSKETLAAVVSPDTRLVVSQAVAQQLPQELSDRAKKLANGGKYQADGIEIEAIAAYNLTPDRLKFHEKGRGNGYVLTIEGRRIYVSGDTEDVPEMLALKNIDVAFICMNLPYTMTVEQAAHAVLTFKPKVVYPYHFRGSDVQKFKELVGEDRNVEVRLRDWYK